MDPQPDLDRPQLRSPSAPPRAAKVHRRPAVRGADPGHDYDAPRVHRGLPRRQQALLPPGRFGKGGGSAVVRELANARGGTVASAIRQAKLGKSRQPKAGGFYFAGPSGDISSWQTI